MCGQLPGESEQAKGVETEQPVRWGGKPCSNSLLLLREGKRRELLQGGQLLGRGGNMRTEELPLSLEMCSDECLEWSGRAGVR